MGALAGMPEKSESPGGCDECNAVTVMERDPRNDGMLLITVQHDDWCPFLRTHQGKQGGAKKANARSRAIRKAFNLDVSS